jgi:nuclear pore complex protein Nup98-Nup96
LTLQKQYTKITIINGVPSACLKTDPAPVEFSDMAKAVAIDTAAGVHEQHAWQLLSLLFDDGDKIPSGIDEEHMHLYRKEQLSEFWKVLVWDDAQKHAQQAASLEEKAIAHLSCNDVAEACNSLLTGFDLRLATMIAQIGGDASMRQSLATQIEEWRRLDVLSEMEDSHRALYELLAGNCAESEGKTGSGREDKASTFGICSRFALDWRRAFGLRLWYGIMADESIEWAVAQFADAIRDGFENVKPVPWFIEAGIDMGWADPQPEYREDLLWGILKLYASPKIKDVPANIEDVLAPENISGNPLNARLAFQLFQLFRSRQEDQREADERKVDMPTVRGTGGLQSSTTSRSEKDPQSKDPLVELGDNITLTYAASLHTSEHWTTAVWVYTHLSSASIREHYIRLLVSLFAGTYSLEATDATYVYLTRDLQVPTTWLHAAAALQAKSEGDALRQATHLIHAAELEEAHEVLCRKVGPEAVISRDYDPLRELMGGFDSTPLSSPANDRVSTASAARAAPARSREPVQGWAQGGQIYFDYVELLDLTGQRSTYRVDEDLNDHIQELLVKLQRALEIAHRRLGGCGLEERVALMEIAGTVASQLANSQVRYSNPFCTTMIAVLTHQKTTNHGSVLRLPLTEDLRLKHSCALSAQYYRNLMASNR